MTAKVRDAHGDWRMILIGFRVSEDEHKKIKMLAAKNNMSMRAHIRNQLNQSEIRCRKNLNAYNILAARLEEIIEKAGELDELYKTEESDPDH